MEQDKIHKQSKHTLQYLKKHAEGGVGGDGVHIEELVKAFGLPREELYAVIVFLYSQGLITYSSGDMFKLTPKGMVTIL